MQVGGTVASRYQPGRLLTGSVWDALGAAVLALPPEFRRELLILGLGGASVVRLLRAVAPDARIVGVEIDEAVVQVARSHFDLDALHVEVRLGDARPWLAQERAAYDLVVEDTFVGGDGGLSKAEWLPEPGIDEIRARLAPNGVLVCNVIHEIDEYEVVLKNRFSSVVRVELNDCVNHVYVATDGRLAARAFRSVVKRHPLLRGAVGNLRFRTVRASAA